MVKPYIPEAADIVWLDFDPQVGREQAKRRPALVLTPRTYNRASGLVIVCPFTSVRKDYPFAIPTVLDGRDGALLADQIKSMDWRGRRAKFLARADAPLIARASKLLSLLLGMALPEQ